MFFVILQIINKQKFYDIIYVKKKLNHFLNQDICFLFRKHKIVTK